MARAVSFLYGIISYAVFFLAFLYFIGFLGQFIVPKDVNDGPVMAPLVALPINIGLILLFGLQHTVMARPAFKAAWTKWIPQSIERSTYVLLSSLVLLLVFWLWRPMPSVIWSIESPVGQALMWTIFFAGLLLVLLSTFVIDHFDLFGLKQVWAQLRQKMYQHPPFQVTFFYRFVRHPLYVGWIMFFFAIPTMTVGHLLLAIGLTGYILFAIPYEERDLEHFLGDDYRQYKSRVPALVPRPGRTHATVKASSAGLSRQESG